MKVFKTISMGIIQLCQTYLCFELRSVLLKNRTENLERNTLNIHSILASRYDVIVISLSTVEYTSVSRVYSTVNSDITNLIHGLVDCLERRLVVDG